MSPITRRLYNQLQTRFAVKRSLFLTHRELDALHRCQLTVLADGELVGPGPVGNALCPREAAPVLEHLRYHFVVRLGVEEPWDGAG